MAHLRSINLKELEPDPATFNHGGKIILDAFSPEDEAPMAHPPKGTRGMDLEGTGHRGAEVYSTG